MITAYGARFLRAYASFFADPPAIGGGSGWHPGAESSRMVDLRGQEKMGMTWCYVPGSSITIIFGCIALLYCRNSIERVTSF